MMFNSLCLVLSLACTLVAVLGEQVPCDEGEFTCENAWSGVITHVNTPEERHFCCDQGFSLHLSRGGSRLSDCVCDRHYYVSDCIVGQSACQNMTEVTSVGSLVRCCPNGDRMQGGSGTYCKCARYLTDDTDVVAAE